MSRDINSMVTLNENIAGVEKDDGGCNRCASSRRMAPEIITQPEKQSSRKKEKEINQERKREREIARDIAVREKERWRQGIKRPHPRRRNLPSGRLQPEIYL